jgi:hypothetical protein
MTIMDDEISLCKDVDHWFNDLVYAFIQGVLAASAAATKQTETDSRFKVIGPRQDEA